MIRNRIKYIKPVINLDGPEGNVFHLLAVAKDYMKQLEWPEARRNTFIKQMTESDYENAIQTFDDCFGDYVDLERSGD